MCSAPHLPCGSHEKNDRIFEATHSSPRHDDELEVAVRVAASEVLSSANNLSTE